jgi:hypothetical protein
MDLNAPLLCRALVALITATQQVVHVLNAAMEALYSLTPTLLSLSVLCSPMQATVRPSQGPC